MRDESVLGFQRGVHFQLPELVVLDGKRHDVFQVEFVIAIGLDNRRGYLGELEPLAHGGDGYAQVGGDVFNAHVLAVHLADYFELVGRVHAQALRVFDQADLLSVGGIGEKAAGDGGRLRVMPFLDQLLQCLEAALTRDDFKHTWFTVLDHDQVLQQAFGADPGEQLLVGLLGGFAFACVALAGDQLADRDFDKGGFLHG